jgi:HK97 family phage major capsid protein
MFPKMPIDRYQYQTRAKALQADVNAAFKDLTARRITEKKFNAVCDAAEAEHEKLATQYRTYAKGMRFASNASPSEHGRGSDDPGNTPFTETRTKAMKRNELAFSPFHLTHDNWRQLIHAAEAKAYGFTVSVADTPFGRAATQSMETRIAREKTLRDGDGIHSKAPAYSPVEGAAGSLLEPLLMPDVFRQELEPDRVWSHFPGLPMDSQSVAYLRHTGNVNPAAVTPEGQTIPDVQMQVSQNVATAVKIDALASVTRELLDDYDAVLDFVPSELSRLVIDRETNYLINDPSAGILATSGILTRNANNSVTGIDAIMAGIDDIRVATGAFAVADLVILHPTTWLSTRLTRTTTGAYVLRQNEPEDYLGQVQADSFFGTKVVTNTYCPQGTAIVMATTAAVKAFTRMGLELMLNQFGDAEFTTYGIQFRCVERIALAIVRPSAVCVVSGLLSNPAGGS